MNIDKEWRPDEASPAKKTLETYELLENILLYLPLPGLLYAQRVCKNWRETIQDSDRINKALFKTPFGDRQVSFESPQWLPPRIRGNIPFARDAHHWMTTGPNPGPVIPILNPFLKADLRETSIQNLIWRTLEGNKDKSAMTKGGSWENMLISQPMPVSLVYNCLADRPSRTFYHDMPEAIGDAFHLEDVAGDIQHHLSKCKRCSENWRLTGHQMLRGIPQMETIPLSMSGWDILVLLRSRET